ncbi:MAG: endonuclease/exonuclease/phosphatase family metal-dependent hydrolase [Candidatus Azotimanducaceae bacterium]|jgi:endonuclease/exonuclease/phosphatase family metal-dependent hydrolase
MFKAALVVCVLVTSSACTAQKKSSERTTFTVVTYNVENLFDVDGVAMFDDYQQDGESDGDDPFGYSRAKFLTKLQNIAAVLKTVNEGDGPEVVLFQELEADFTPGNSVEDPIAFVAQYADASIADMLTVGWSDQYAGVPSVAWLLKALSDAGLTGYDVVSVPSHGMDSGIAHTNAVFSKFPIVNVKRHPLLQARDILEAELDVAGNPLIVYVNHWKSGASNPSREPTRVKNAKVLRSLIDARLAADPQADIIVAGDLNSHYNHSILYPEIETGINDVLGSAGSEDFSQSDLYNLWFELPPEARYSEVWRGNRGSLMHMLVTRGLYDDSGISYVDGSYDKLALSGLNVDAIGRPLRWHFTGETGGGASDHLPVMAQFTTAPFKATAELSVGDDAPDFERPLNVDDDSEELDLSDGQFLNAFSDAELAPYVAHLYTVEATVRSMKPLRIQVGERIWPAYYANRSMIEAGGLPAYLKNNEGKVRLVVQPNFYRGKSQLVIEGILGEW